MVTKRLVCHADDRRDLLRRLPAGLAYLLGPGSLKNAGKSAGYPRSLTATELAVVLVGPAAYLASAVGERRRSGPAEVRMPKRASQSTGRGEVHCRVLVVEQGEG
nr:hypothetical protein [Micromonospora sp. DSM 115978]